MSTISFYEYHKIYGFWGKKNFEREVYFKQNSSKILIRHNSHGNRDKEFNLLDNHAKALCLGGSHTWGAAVDLKDRYSNILDSNFNEIDFLNYGQASFGIDQIYFLIKNEIKKINPKYIIIEQYPWALLRTINSYVNGYIRPYFLIDKKGNIIERGLPKLSRIKIYRNLYGGYLKFKKDFNEFENKYYIKFSI